MNEQALKNEIEHVFPFIEKPQGISISFHEDDCSQCGYLREDLSVYLDPELPMEGIRDIHQEMSCLSAEGWRWALPSYLRFCFTKEAVENGMETEYLIYNLSPAAKHEAETTERLSALSDDQISCLKHFLEWCKEHEYWAEYCPSEIEAGIEFVSKIRA